MCFITNKLPQSVKAKAISAHTFIFYL